MKDFLKQLLTSTLAYILGSVIILLLLFVVISGKISSASEKERIEIADNSLLVIRLEGGILERGNTDPFAVFSGGGAEAGLNLRKLTQAVVEAAADDRIKGIFLDIRTSQGGGASYEAFRNALKQFKASGKFIIAHGEVFTEKDIYISSIADSVFLYPTGMVEWNGLVSNPMFLRGMLDRWGIEPVLFRVGSFKSAAEQVTERRMSDANREQITTLLNDMWTQMLKAVAEGRNVTTEHLDSLASKFTVITAQDAVDARLVDGLLYEDEVRAMLRRRLGLEADAEIPMVKYAQYYDQIERDYKENKIAVIYAVGEIVYGRGDQQTIGNLTLCQQIREAREDDNVKAIVLRVNSPGGSALASDMIWREIMLTRAVKPVISSMGDVAASGGYYISAPCNRILAEPTTITGSIGVIGLLMNTEKFFTNELGITFDRAYSSSNQYADLGNPNRPMSEYERTRIQAGVDDIYQDFLQRVAEGRGFASPDSVHPIAQGRVWSGTRALQLKLVDELGGLDRAIEVAAQTAEVTEYRVVEIPREQEPLEALLSGMGGEEAENNNDETEVTQGLSRTEVRNRMLETMLPEEYTSLLHLFRVFSDRQGIYMHTGVDIRFN